MENPVPSLSFPELFMFFLHRYWREMGEILMHDRKIPSPPGKAPSGGCTPRKAALAGGAFVHIIWISENKNAEEGGLVFP